MNSKYKRLAPSVTVVLVCYNQERYIKDAVLSVLNQEYSPLKIIISDDCSQDKTVSIIEKIVEEYKGPHKVQINKNTINMGLIKHINLVNSLVDSELLVIAAGDDISHKNRVSETIKAYRLAEKAPTSLYSSVNKMTMNGELLGSWAPPIEQSYHSIVECSTSGSLIIGASHAWHKSLFTIFGEIKEQGAYEDLVLAYRSAILDGLLYIDQPLVDYRIDVGISNIGQSCAVTQKKSELLKKSINVMKAVLTQRLLDSALIEDEVIKTNTTRMIKQELLKIEFKYEFLKGEKLYLLFIRAIRTSTLLLFFKLLSKRSRGRI